MEIYCWSGAGLLGLVLVALFHMHVLQHRRIARLGDRLAHLTAGISLLTDTVEGGLRDVAQEIERIGARRQGGSRAQGAERPRSVACPRQRVAAGRCRTSRQRKRCRRAKCVCDCRWPAPRPAGRKRMPRCADERCGRWRPDLSRLSALPARRFAGWARCSSTASGTARARVWSRRRARV